MPLDRVVEILEEGRGNHFDPDLLGSFLEIAPDLHADLNHIGISELRVAMQEINRTYFASGLETLPA
jgi:HD-GYP domain-containing protein (c-di-GMP phosphodiesterase class II)